jgi:hypothetical protein
VRAPLANQAKALLEALARGPDDAALRERAARALDREGQSADAVRVLLERFVNLNGHEEGPLPCLCKGCLEPSAAGASARGQDFFRDYVVAAGRVLFYWAPDELRATDRRVRRSVRAALVQRIAFLRAKGGAGHST